MTDNQLIAHIIQVLEAQLALWYRTVGCEPVEVLQKNQPTKQGVPTAPTVFIEKLFDRRYGFVAVTYEEELIEPVIDMMEEKEAQKYLTTFQLSARMLQDPRNLQMVTASDLANVACSMLQSRYALQAFDNNKIEVLRVTDVRNSYDPDDQDRQEASPSFDIVLGYTRSFVTHVSKLDNVKAKLVSISNP